MEQFLQILQFLKVVLWPGALINIILGFIAAVITILIKNRFEDIIPKNLPGVITQPLSDEDLFGEERARVIKEGTEQLLMNSIGKFQNSSNLIIRLSGLQYISQMAKEVDDKTLEDLANKGLTDENPQLRGEMCYALGMSGKARFKGLVQRLLYDSDQWVRKQAAEALKQLAADRERYIDVSPPETSYLREQVSGLVEEVAGLRKEVAKLRPESQPDDYTRVVIEEFEQNRSAYEHEEPQLLEKYRGQFAAFCNSKLVAIGPDRKQVIQEAMQAEPTARPYIRQVGVEIPSRPAGRR